MPIKRTKEDFIKKAKEIHNNKYDYSLVEYIDNKTKVKIICPEHEIFETTPTIHIHHKSKCPKCSKKIKKELKIKNYTEIFINKAREIHNNKYDYSLVEYIDNKTKIKIKCPNHGVFETTPSVHINLKCECPNCAKEKRYNK